MSSVKTSARQRGSWSKLSIQSLSGPGQQGGLYQQPTPFGDAPAEDPIHPCADSMGFLVVVVGFGEAEHAGITAAMGGSQLLPMGLAAGIRGWPR